jgi:hypothetical protein
LCIGLISCNNKVETSLPFEQGSKANRFEDLKDNVTKITQLIYKECYDGENIDYDKMDCILQENGFPTLLGFSKTRNTGIISSVDLAKSHLSEKQLIIFDRILSLNEPTKEDFEKIKIDSSATLEGEELETMLLTIDGTEAVYFGMKDGVSSSIQTRGVNAMTFICNLNASGIGTIWGVVAGGIAASTGVGLVVGLVVGAAVSTISCG